MTTPLPSDEWLLALVAEKSPGEFTTAELDALRRRASASPEIRRALVERLDLETTLHAALHEPDIDSSHLLRRARRIRRRNVLGGAIASGTVVLLIVATITLVRPKPGRPLPPGRDRAAVPSELQGERASTKATDESKPRSVVAVEAPRPVRNPSVTATVPMTETPATTDENDATWGAVLGDNAPVVAFATSAFSAFGETAPGFEVADEFSAAELKQWIAAVPGKPFQVTENQWRGKRFAGLEGTARLRPRWCDEAVLRLAPFDVGEFALHFWKGRDGVSIRFYPNQRPRLLAAYAVQRGDGPTPQSCRLLATDSGRLSRSNAGAFEVRCRDGRLVVTRGAVPLLVVPGVATPDEVVLEGRMRLRSLAMYRGEATELPERRERTNLLGDESIESLDWTLSDSPAAKLEKTPGHITLSWTEPKPEGPRKIVWAGVRLPDSVRNSTGLCEAVFHVSSLTPGTGLYLGDDDGRPVHTLFASENAVAGAPMLAFGWSNRDGGVPDPRWRQDSDPAGELVPAAGPGTWIKLVVGTGGMKAFVSSDGVHWGAAWREPQRNVRGPWSSIGVYAFADEHPRSIAVSHIAIHELSAIATLADAHHVDRVPGFDAEAEKRSADWLQWVEATRPDDVVLDAWLRACSVKTLARGASDSVVRTVIGGLANDVIASQRSAAESHAVLAGLTLLSDDWSDGGKRFMGHYDRLSRRISERTSDPAEVARELNQVLEGSLNAPLWSEQSPATLPPSLPRSLAAAAAWTDASGDAGSSVVPARAASRRAAFYLTPSHPESGYSTEDEDGLATLTGWAGEQSAGENGVARAGARFAWQHPLVTEPGREAQTLAAELDVALAAGAYDDAARLVSTIAELTDLVPAAGDPDRFVPPVGLIAEISERHPELVASLTDAFGPEGLLHVRQSIAAGDDDAVRVAAIRYFGTPAAAEARRWLGERELSAGRFAEAEGHFAVALSAAPDAERPGLAARRRLAAALAGVPLDGEPSNAAVEFGEETLNGEEFQRLIDELQKTRAPSDAGREPQVANPKAVAVAPQARGRFEGDAGRSPGRNDFRRYDWAGRQIGVTLDRGVAWMTNRYQVAAFNLGNKSPTWAVGLGNEQGETHSLPGVAFRPVPAGDRLYVRRMLARGPELACLSTNERGKVYWRSDSNLMFASDPVLDDGRLIAVTCASAARSGGPFTLALTRLRPDDGSVLASLPLVVINDAGDAKPSASLVANEYGFLIASTGTLVRCDLAGNIVWIRRLPHLPAAVDVDADLVPPDDPIVVDGRLFAVPAGSRAVVSLDAGTGRLNWVRTFGNAERLAGIAGGRLVVRTSDGLLGLDPESGASTWQYHRENLLEGQICDETSVLATARTPLENNLDGLTLVQIDAATGVLKSEQVVRVMRNDEIRCGPLFIHDGQVWGFIGEGWRDPKRTLVEFVPDESLPVVVPANWPGAIDRWLNHVQPQSSLNVDAVLSGWTMTGNQPGKGATFHDEHQGEAWVMQTQAGGTHAARFVRRVKLEPGRKLVARVARVDDEGWTLRLLVDGKPFASEPVDKQTAPESWRTVTFDLSRLAGREVTLAIDQAPPAAESDRTTKAFWKSVAIE